MTNEELLRQFASLPPEGQRQVLELIAALRERFDASRPPGDSSGLEDDGFVGMWRDREDMEDSGAWVRGVREREWVKRNG
jgi:hypothetical protein